MVDFKKGLTDEQVAESKQKWGTNALTKQEPESLWHMFIEAFKDIWIIVLCIALFVKLALSIIGFFFPALSEGMKDLIEVISIVVAIIMATGFSTHSAYKSAVRNTELTEKFNKTTVKVYRNGGLHEILSTEVVTGDIVLVQAGDKIPVDGLIREGKIKVSQAVLNGESRDETKTRTESDDEAKSTDYSSKHKVFMGSVVTSGEAYIEVTVVGDATELGKINLSIQDDSDSVKSASEEKLEKVAVAIGKLGVGAASIAAILHVVVSYMGYTEVATAVNWVSWIAEAVMLMASVIIMAVPEGLPMMNALVSGMVSENMYERNILVKRQDEFSDSAYINILFSDKTGTITEGNLSLVEIMTGDGAIDAEMKSKDFITSITLNNLAKVSEGKAIGSNNMDRALLTYALKHGFKESELSHDNVKEINGFDSEKKCATVDMKDGSVYWKGATEKIIDQVTHYIDHQGIKHTFTAKNKALVESKMKEQAQRTMKLLSVAKLENNEVILYGILCLRDNVRSDIVETVNTLKEAGITTVMVTGDASDTAVAIAKEAHIYNEAEGHIALSHEELEAMSDDELKSKLDKLRVVSRAKPLDKKRLVQIAQSMDYVAGMTGDGVNDAPALASGIGFSMGSGTSVAQEASGMVLLDDSLTSIKDCILYSRTVANSVGKFLIFQLTVNVATLLMNIICPLFGHTEPFSIVSILWINLIMDTLAALAFGGEPALDRYMKDKPVKRKADILTPYIKTTIGVAAIFITLGSVLILNNAFGIINYVKPLGYGVIVDTESFNRTFMFAFFIYSIIFNSFNTRSTTCNLLEGIKQNKKFLVVMGGIFIMQTLLLEFGGAVFGTEPLTWKGYVVAMGLALLIIPIDMIKKAILNARKK